jgi:hypothetical protein
MGLNEIRFIQEMLKHYPWADRMNDCHHVWKEEKVSGFRYGKRCINCGNLICSDTEIENAKRK